jgi:hypothetical protein
VEECLLEDREEHALRTTVEERPFRAALIAHSRWAFRPCSVPRSRQEPSPMSTLSRKPLKSAFLEPVEEHAFWPTVEERPFRAALIAQIRTGL